MEWIAIAVAYRQARTARFIVVLHDVVSNRRSERISRKITPMALAKLFLKKLTKAGLEVLLEAAQAKIEVMTVDYKNLEVTLSEQLHKQQETTLVRNKFRENLKQDLAHVTEENKRLRCTIVLLKREIYLSLSPHSITECIKELQQELDQKDPPERQC